jgi:hypothetical protein
MNNFCIFIPAYNASGTLQFTLSGVNTAASHILKKVDVFIVDDCSPINSFDNINLTNYPNLNLNLFRNECNLGERGTINKYFEYFLNKFEWVFLIHADDIPKNNWLDIIISYINGINGEEVFTIWSSFDVIDENNCFLSFGDDSGGCILESNENLNLAAKYITKITASYHVSGAAINLKLFKQIEGFDAALPQYGDTTFFADGLINGFSHIYIRNTLTLYRISSSSVSSLSVNSNRDINEIIVILKKYRFILTGKQIFEIKIKALNIIIRRLIKLVLKFKISIIFNTINLGLKVITA